MLALVMAAICASTSCQCPPERLVVYRLELTTFWDEGTFPKQYPQWRPSAQWSKTVGRLLQLPQLSNTFVPQATPMGPVFPCSPSAPLWTRESASLWRPGRRRQAVLS